MRLTPETAAATRVAGTRLLILGGTLVSVIGVTGLLLALLNLISVAWEQLAMAVIGATIAIIGRFVSRNNASQ